MQRNGRGAIGLLVALAALLGQPAGARGWTHIGDKWPLASLPLRYTVGPGSEDFADEESVALVRRVFQRWEDVGCAYVAFEYLGRGADFGLVDGGVGRADDGFNNVSWCDGCLGEAAVGIAVYTISGDGALIECDEYLEDQWTFTLDHDEAAENAEVVDAEAVVAQESGHCLGLGHSEVERATMFQFYTAGWEMWTPDADDVEGLCALYPLEDGCVGKADCRDGALCVDGACVMEPPPPPLLFGEVCTDAAECESGVCVLDPTRGESVCSERCRLGAPECPDASACRRFGPCSEAFCVTAATGDGARGAGCGEDADCASGLCDDGPGGRVCAVPCDGASSDECPPETACSSAGVACGACRAGEEPAPFGTPCEEDADCEGGICAAVGDDRYCSSACEVDDECPAGFVCGELPDRRTVCRPEGGVMGDPCATNDDCGSGICGHFGDGDYCSRSCEDTQCPAGWECMTTVTRALCVREAEDGCGCGVRGAARGGARGGMSGGAGLGLALWAARRRRRGRTRRP